MKKRTVIIFALTVAMLTALPLLSQARPWRGETESDGPAYGCGGPGAYEEGERGGRLPDFTPEQEAVLGKIMEAFREKERALYGDLAAKKMELDYLADNPKTEPKMISSLVNDIKTLRDKLFDLRSSTAGTMQKDLGLKSRQAQALLGGGKFFPGGHRHELRDCDYGGRDWRGPRHR
ncbi:MAG: hypothetical protein LBQ63_07530 [Deltaproteobacteria bacterium]|jgi:hypothetical protein|nr:hypothetical protein [Deltaproteobacteria bacterium]